MLNWKTDEGILPSRRSAWVMPAVIIVLALVIAVCGAFLSGDALMEKGLPRLDFMMTVLAVAAAGALLAYLIEKQDTAKLEKEMNKRLAGIGLAAGRINDQNTHRQLEFLFKLLEDGWTKGDLSRVQPYFAPACYEQLTKERSLLTEKGASVQNEVLEIKRIWPRYGSTGDVSLFLEARMIRCVVTGDKTDGVTTPRRMQFCFVLGAAGEQHYPDSPMEGCPWRVEELLRTEIPDPDAKQHGDDREPEKHPAHNGLAPQIEYVFRELQLAIHEGEPERAAAFLTPACLSTLRTEAERNSGCSQTLNRRVHEVNGIRFITTGKGRLYAWIDVRMESFTGDMERKPLTGESAQPHDMLCRLTLTPADEPDERSRVLDGFCWRVTGCLLEDKGAVPVQESGVEGRLLTVTDEALEKTLDAPKLYAQAEWLVRTVEQGFVDGDLSRAAAYLTRECRERLELRLREKRERYERDTIQITGVDGFRLNRARRDQIRVSMTLHLVSYTTDLRGELLLHDTRKPRTELAELLLMRSLFEPEDEEMEGFKWRAADVMFINADPWQYSKRNL